MNLQRRKDKNLKGWLKRKGGRMNSWSRRWFVLTDKFLFMYMKEEETKSSDCITLDEHMIVEPPLDLSDPKRVYFDIVTDSDTAPSETVLSLCAESEEEKKIWIRALKRALYADKGGALFSQSLEEILCHEKLSGRRIPYIVEICVEYLYKNALDVEGIFRLPGRQSAIKDIMSRLERGHKVSFEDEGTDVHAVASVLKAFLRDLPDSIIPCGLFQKFMNFALRFQSALSEAERDAAVLELASAMSLVPVDNYVILKYICRFLQDVGKQESVNKMSMMNLGTVFGYNIIRHIDKENSQLLMCTADLSQNLVYMLINYFAQVFALEYNDSGTVANNVPTADLLRMSRVLDLPPVMPLSPGHIADLEGIDLMVGSPPSRADNSLRPNRGSSSSSDIRLRNTSSVASSDSNNDDDTAFLSSQEVKAEISKRPTLLAVASQYPGCSRSLPASPTTSDAPIPPQRSKSKKISRHRMVSDRRRPGGIVVVSGEGVVDRPVSPRERGVNSQDVIAALEKVSLQPSNNESCNNGESGDSRHSNHVDEAQTVDSEINTTERAAEQEPVRSPTGIGKPVPSVRRHRPDATTESRLKHLQQQVESLTEEMTQQKKHHRSQVCALQAQLTDMRQKYERRIETMEVQFHSQRDRLEAKLVTEKEACAEAVAHTIKLKEELHTYQMQYGELPT